MQKTKSDLKREWITKIEKFETLELKVKNYTVNQNQSILLKFFRLQWLSTGIQLPIVEKTDEIDRVNQHIWTGIN